MSAGGGGAGGGARSAVVRQGHLRKLKTMKKKYFVLRAETAEHSARLEYYESEKKFRFGAAPRRVLPLKSCFNISRRLDLKQKHVIALFFREEQFCIVAENEVDLHEWLTVLLKHHRNEDASEELLHPIQHVWQVTVQKKGLGATKNIQGLYNLCLTDKTLTLVKIKSQNNVISDLGIPERVEYSLKNIRTCGDSECFFYMEVGRQTSTGAGELWMLSDDSNIAQSMHSTVYHAMTNCAKETENERDHVFTPKVSGQGSQQPLPARRQTYSDGRGRAGLSNDAGPPRNRCDSMPSRACSSFDTESRAPPRLSDLIDGLESSRDDTDSVEWHRTPRIPEEPDFCDPTIRELVSTSLRGSSVQHSRTSSMGVDDPDPPAVPDGYLPMAPGHDPLGGLISASSGSVCSGTPSTDPRFSEYQLEPATSHIVDAERPPRAYSVGSRPAPRADPPRHRAYSVGARHRPPPPSTRHQANTVCSAPLLPRASAEDLMELDFSNNSPSAKVIVARTPPAPGFADPRPRPVDEYVDMSPRNAGYVEMRPGDALSRSPPAAAPAPAAAHTPATPDGYVEMVYGRAPTRPIAITSARPAPLAASSPDERRRPRSKESRTPIGSQPTHSKDSRTPIGSGTLFPLSLDSPASPPELLEDVLDEDLHGVHHPLCTVREISEDGRTSVEVSSSPSYVKLALPGSKPIAAPAKTPDQDVELSCNPLANKTLARGDGDARPDTSTVTLVLAGGGAPARFSVTDDKSPPPASPLAGAPPLNYAALDLEPKKPSGAPAQHTYTQIDFARSEKLHADGN